VSQEPLKNKENKKAMLTVFNLHTSYATCVL